MHGMDTVYVIEEHILSLVYIRLFSENHPETPARNQKSSQISTEWNGKMFLNEHRIK
jgi:hypothetical protein